MKMTHILAAAALVSLAGAVRADVKVTQSLSIDNPQLKAAMQSMSPEQRAQLAKTGLGGTMHSVVYVSGRKSRTDMGPYNSTLVDAGAGRVTALNRLSHTYATQTLNSLSGPAGRVKASIKPTGRSKVILGHRCDDYHLTVATESGGNPLQISGDLWTAPDLPRPAIAYTGGPMAALQSQWNKVHGMPLQLRMTINGSAMGVTTITSNATAISTTPLPGSIFTIPAGYKPGPVYSSPLGGGPMGGGLGR